MVTTTESGRTMGRKEREWGQMGVMQSAGTPGWTMEPPAARLYAVDPVGELRMTPSAATLVTW